MLIGIDTYYDRWD